MPALRAAADNDGARLLVLAAVAEARGLQRRKVVAVAPAALQNHFPVIEVLGAGRLGRQRMPYFNAFSKVGISFAASIDSLTRVVASSAAFNAGALTCLGNRYVLDGHLFTYRKVVTAAASNTSGPRAAAGEGALAAVDSSPLTAAVTEK